MEDEEAYLGHVQRHPLCMQRQLLHKIHEEVYPVAAHMLAKEIHLVAKESHLLADHLVAGLQLRVFCVKYLDVKNTETLLEKMSKWFFVFFISN